MDYVVKAKMVSHFEFRVQAFSPVEAQSRAVSMMDVNTVPIKVEYLMVVLPTELAHEEL